MGTEGRYFGRWLMPILPDHQPARGALRRARRSARCRGRGTPGTAGDPAAAPGAGPAEAAPARGRRAPARVLAGATVLVAALLAQGLLASIHSGLVLSRADTRTQTRDWMIANIPRGAKVVVEPVSPDQWARETGSGPPGCEGTRYRWCKWPSLYTFIDARRRDRRRPPARSQHRELRAHALAGADRALRAARLLLGRDGVHRGRPCRGRPARGAARDRLLPRSRPPRASSCAASRPTGAARGRSRSTSTGASTTTRSAYARPGPLMSVYRLHGGRCAKSPA